MSFTFGKKKVGINSPLSSFNELQVNELTPTAQGDFVYGLNSRVFEGISYAGGGYSGSDGIMFVTSSASPSGSGAVQLRNALRYQAGQGSLFRGTALFSTGTAGNTQIIGLGNGECGYFFGYLQDSFGILHQDTSQREIRALTITTGAATGNVTVTLNGDSIVVPITGNNDTSQTAYQLSTKDYTQLGNGWLVDVVGSTVYFLSSRAQPLNDGAYSVSGASVVGTFARTEAGVSPSSDFVTQSAWNIDPMDGTGPSRMVLNPQRGNVYQIGFQYLGFGNAFFGIEESDSGRVTPVHIIKNANNRTTPVLRNPNMSGLVGSSNIPGLPGTNVPVGTVSLATFNEGKTAKLSPKFAYAQALTIPDTNLVWKPIAALKVNRVHKGKACFGEIDFLSLSATNNTGATSPKSYKLGIFLDVRVSGDVNFQYIDQQESVVSYSVINAANSTMTNTVIPSYSVALGGGTTINVDLKDLNLTFGAGRVIIIAVNSDDAISGDFSINWFEKQ